MFHELFLSDDFNRYRKHEMLTMAKYIWGMYEKHPERMIGAIKLALKIIRLPNDLAGDEDKDIIQTKTKEVINSFKISYMHIEE